MTRAWRSAPSCRALASCPVCAEPAGDTVFASDQVPVMCNVLFDSATDAQQAATGSIDLVLCPSCGLLWNSAFDERAVEYSSAYENSLHFSPRFQRYVTELADELIERHDLTGRTVLEIGSGKGDFLELLCDAGVATGIGFDPSYGGETPARPHLQFMPSLFPEGSFPDADFVCARHVFEHLPAPTRVLRSIVAAIPPDRPVGFYVEVPDGTYLLREVALWDVIYEHPLHFTAPALTRLLSDAGLSVNRVTRSFADQYLVVEGSTAPSAHTGGCIEVGALPDLASTFQVRAADQRQRWSRRLAPLLDDGPVALWGAGSKGVSFLTTVPGAEHLAAVVDINPRKQGRHVPRTGQQVVPPETLVALRPRAIVLLNAIYADEIQTILNQLDVDAELVTVPST